ncbi:hypothetical protein G7Z17_g416 [Cylindrodendrum hubeiense]|uniref:Uncharacterized protein n=1 Tax=Cylindrodendrum hubeiense TaxID=595255 RepID=A0A9P5LMC5_9HYPO|nr:hypothetical protein G7Z17_g416 [Cylindrodendrum hubeiense]
MAERLKHEVKEKAQRRRGERGAHTSVSRISAAEVAAEEWVVPPQQLPRGLDTPMCELLALNIPNLMEPCPQASATSPQRGADCTFANKDAGERIPFGRSDTILIMFYLEHVLPFLFPFYQPCLLDGGRSWVLEMMISSPVVRQATLCQSSYFFSLAQRTADHNSVWETVLMQSRDAFGVLRQSLQVIDGSSITQHLHGAVRIMASIMQVQRFEISVLSFDNCQTHLNAALALFKQLLDSSGTLETVCSRFHVIMGRLGPPSLIRPGPIAQIPSAEQAAFRFSSTLLILDDIIASTVLQEQPRLYEYHGILLHTTNGTDALIDLEAVVGCQNWVLLHIGEISALDAWKQRCKREGNLDVMELVHRATVIKEALEAHLKQLETGAVTINNESSSSLLNVLTANLGRQPKLHASQSVLATRVWAHAALLFLSVVVSGWQPASADVRHHVDRIMGLITWQLTPPALMRTVVWPFCVAGCLAEPAQEVCFRGMVEALQPPSVFGTARKALQIMESVWSDRDANDAASRDLAACFRRHGDLVLLV